MPCNVNLRADLPTCVFLNGGVGQATKGFVTMPTDAGWNTVKEAYGGGGGGGFGNNRGKSAFFNDRGNANRGR